MPKGNILQRILEREDMGLAPRVRENKDIFEEVERMKMAMKHFLSRIGGDFYQKRP